MSSNKIKPKDIIEARKKYPLGQLFVLSNDFKGKKKDARSFYLPISMKTASGKEEKINLSYAGVVITSNAKLPSTVKLEECSALSVSFRYLTEKDFENTDYYKLPEINPVKSSGAKKSTKEIDDETTTNIEKRDKKIKELIRLNNELCEALDIINEEYVYHAKNIINSKTRPDFIKAIFDKKAHSEINTMKQTSRKPTTEEKNNNVETDENGKIPIPIPIFRLNIKVNKDNNYKLGTAMYKDGVKTSEHRYIVYDARHSSVNEGKSAIAKVSEKINGKPTSVDLNVKNAKNFITYMSLTAGTVPFDSIIFSAKGISLAHNFSILSVAPHKPMKQELISPEDTAIMNEYAVENDDIICADEPESPSMKKPVNKNLTKNKQINPDEITDEEQPILDEPQEEEEKPKSKSKPKVKPQVKQTVKEPEPEPDQEADDDNEDDQGDDNEDDQGDDNEDEKESKEEKKVKSIPTNKSKK